MALTQKQLANLLGKKYDKVTIYRTLETLLLADIVHKAFYQEREWHFELADRCGSRQCHPHFSCRLCGKNFCLEGISYPIIQIPANFELLHQKILIEGICPACKK